MTFEEFWRKRVELGLDPYCTSDIELARFVWNAAKEDSKPVADILYVNYPCMGLRERKGVPYWTARNTAATVIKETKEQAEQWAIENGYRIADS